MLENLITCVVPTHNRPQFLRRLLKFYAEFPTGFPMRIIDSSREGPAAENVAIVEEAKASQSIEYKHVDMNYIDKCVFGMDQVQTPYAVMCADDDYFFPDAIRPCVEFLQQSPGYSSALGKTVQLSPTRPISLPRQLQVLRGYSIEQERPLERCLQMIRQLYSSYYAIYRTEILRDNFRLTAANTNAQLNVYGPEMMLSQLSVLRGKIKVLPIMYSIRERHDDNLGNTVRNGPQAEAVPLFERFKACLVNQLVLASEDRTAAEHFLEERFGFFRDSHYGTRRKRRTYKELAIQTLHGIVDRIRDQVKTDETHYVRQLKPSDISNCGPEWSSMVNLIREFPMGIAQGSVATRS